MVVRWLRPSQARTSSPTIPRLVTLRDGLRCEFMRRSGSGLGGLVVIGIAVSGG